MVGQNPASRPQYQEFFLGIFFWRVSQSAVQETADRAKAVHTHSNSSIRSSKETMKAFATITAAVAVFACFAKAAATSGSSNDATAIAEAALQDCRATAEAAAAAGTHVSCTKLEAQVFALTTAAADTPNTAPSELDASSGAQKGIKHLSEHPTSGRRAASSPLRQALEGATAEQQTRALVQHSPPPPYGLPTNCWIDLASGANPAIIKYDSNQGSGVTGDTWWRAVCPTDADYDAYWHDWDEVLTPYLCCGADTGCTVQVDTSYTSSTSLTVSDGVGDNMDRMKTLFSKFLGVSFGQAEEHTQLIGREATVAPGAAAVGVVNKYIRARQYEIWERFVSYDDQDKSIDWGDKIDYQSDWYQVGTSELREPSDGGSEDLFTFLTGKCDAPIQANIGDGCYNC